MTPHAPTAYDDSAKPEIWPFIPRGATRLLDVGCWKGAFGAAMVARGMEVWCIEPREEAAQVASSRIHRVVLGAFPADAPEATFDVITFLDVIEHLPDPWDAVNRAKALLDPQGVVVALIPNVRHLSVVWPLVRGGRWDYADAGILDRTHLRFFTQTTANELFTGAGYRLLTSDLLNPSPATGWLRFLMPALGRRRQEFEFTHLAIVAQPRGAAPLGEA